MNSGPGSISNHYLILGYDVHVLYLYSSLNEEIKRNLSDPF